MAAEYRLNFTAKEIDEKLSSIDNKQDKLIYDDLPTENSENSITSGSVYAALQGLGGGSEGSSNLQAGNLLEIKDGIIRSTLGDTLEGFETSYNELYNFTIPTLNNEGSFFTGVFTPKTINFPNVGEEFNVNIIDKQGNLLATDIIPVVELQTGESEIMPCIIFNSIVNLESENLITPIDNNKPAFILAIGMDDEAWVYSYCCYDDYSGMTVSLGEMNQIQNSQRLPDNALLGSKYIEVENGIVSSTLGNIISTEKEKTLVHIKVLTMDGIDFNDDDINDAYYVDNVEFIGSYSAPVPGSKITIELTSDNPEEEPIVYENLELKEFSENDINTYGESEDDYGVPDEYKYYCLSFNTNVSLIDLENNENCFLTKINEDIPAGVLMWPACNDFIYPFPEGNYFSEDLANYTFKITSQYTDTKYITLPKNAIALDNEPVLGSDNLLTSDTIYKSISCSGYKCLFDETEEGCHAEGYRTESTRRGSHSEGCKTKATGQAAHAEGYQTKATGDDSHAEGSYTIASSSRSHAEGYQTVASGYVSHAEGDYTKAIGSGSHAEGYSTIAAGQYQHVQGRYNIEDTNSIYAHIVGNGNYDSNRSNAHTLDWSGNAWYAGYVEAPYFVLTSPSGYRFKISIDDSGSVSTSRLY